LDWCITVCVIIQMAKSWYGIYSRLYPTPVEVEEDKKQGHCKQIQAACSSVCKHELHNGISYLLLVIKFLAVPVSELLPAFDTLAAAS
jgi:hypothetical protein